MEQKFQESASTCVPTAITRINFPTILAFIFLSSADRIYRFASGTDAK
jgi:hypothetical protein